MRPAPGEMELLRPLAEMPFLDRLELACLSGRSRGAVYEAAHRLEEDGLAASIPHAADLTPPTRRYCLTAEGLWRLAELTGETVEDLLRSCPVSEQWRRVLLDRLDAIASLYRLASTVASAAHPVSLRLFRAGPLDAALLLPGGRTIGVVRQGPSADRTAFAKRLWRLGQGPLPGAVLVLASDGVRLRHARRLLARSPVNAALALERDAALAGADVSIWRPPTGNAVLSLRYVLDRTDSGGELPPELPFSRADLPGDLAADARRALPALLKPTEKRALDLLADWPWILQKDMSDLLGVSETRVSRLTNPLEGFGLVARSPAAGGRLALSDRGLALLARRDRTSVGVARKRRSVTPMDANAPLDWRNISGGREQAAAPQPGAHRRRPRFHGRPGPPVPRPGLADGAVRPAPPGVPPFPPRRRAARRLPRRLRRPAPGSRQLGFLPGVGASRRQARHHVPAPGPLPALLLLPPAHRRPRHQARGPGGLRRRHRRHPLPPAGRGRNAAGWRGCPAVGLPPGGRPRPGAAGAGLADSRRLGTGPAASRAIKHE